MSQKKADLVIIGGGIVGLATAYRFTQKYPKKRLILLEKERKLGQHQTGHNSGVIHSGIYYKPGSLKAINCRKGKKALEAFCEKNDIPYEICGKVIVAVEEKELPKFNEIYQRGKANGVQCEIIGPERLKELEPHARGIKAIHVPEAGIVDYTKVCDRLGELIREAGSEVVLEAKVRGVKQLSDEVVIETTQGEFHGKNAVNCGGLQSDRIAKMTGEDPGARIVPFRGEYYELKPEARGLVKNLIYPTPDPEYPFLGVHFTRMIDGRVECGPNAVLAFAREAYKKTDFNLRDFLDSVFYIGFLRIIPRYWKMGMGEMWRSWNKGAFVKALQRMLPDIQKDQLEPAPAGIRAQAMKPDGSMVDDFVIAETARVVNVLNAPSPAATASLNIGSLIVDKIAKRVES